MVSPSLRKFNLIYMIMTYKILVSAKTETAIPMLKRQLHLLLLNQNEKTKLRQKGKKKKSILYSRRHVLLWDNFYKN